MPEDKKIEIKSNKFPLSDAINSYAAKRLEKYLHKYSDFKNLVFHVSRKSSKTKEKYSLLIQGKFGKVSFVINESGNNVYAMIDSIAKKLQQKISKLHEIHATHSNVHFAGIS